MLSKNNKILIGCLALLLVLSVGYALFSDTITINGSATAKGDFEITTEIVNLYEQDWLINQGHEQKGIVKNPEITVNNNAVSTSVELGMPGSSYTFAIKVTNTGTIPAKLSSILDKTNNKIILDKNTEDSFLNCSGEEKVNYACMYVFTDDGYILDYSADYPIESRFEDVFGVSIDALEAVLDPGEEVYFFIEASWLGNSTTPGDPLELNWQLEINYEQITE